MSVRKDMTTGFHRAWPRCAAKEMDLEINEKIPQNDTAEVAGVTKIKAVEAVGGKTGKYIMYAGYVSPPEFLSACANKVQTGDGHGHLVSRGAPCSLTN